MSCSRKNVNDAYLKKSAFCSVFFELPKTTHFYMCAPAWNNIHKAHFNSDSYRNKLKANESPLKTAERRKVLR